MKNINANPHCKHARVADFFIHLNIKKVFAEKLGDYSLLLQIRNLKQKIYFLIAFTKYRLSRSSR